MNYEEKSLKIKEVTPYEKNAKKHPAEQIANIAESIRQFGWTQPIVVDEDGVIIIGHGRFAAAKKLGLKEVPCRIVSGLSEEKKRELRLIDNKTNESEWDFDLLAEDLDGLDFDGFDLDFGIVKDDDFGTDFSLPSGDKSYIEQMTFTLHREQAEAIRRAIESVKDEIDDEYTFGNQNSNGNALYEVIREWEEQRI